MSAIPIRRFRSIAPKNEYGTNSSGTVAAPRSAIAAATAASRSSLVRSVRWETDRANCAPSASPAEGDAGCGVALDPPPGLGAGTDGPADASAAIELMRDWMNATASVLDLTAPGSETI